jgi:hypothetical protein
MSDLVGTEDDKDQHWKRQKVPSCQDFIGVRELQNNGVFGEIRVDEQRGYPRDQRDYEPTNEAANQKAFQDTGVRVV